MKCPKCGADKPRVTDSRSDSTCVYRQRTCRKCSHVFYTSEQLDDCKSDLLSIHNLKYNAK